ncbi:hypothetical protein RhiJN_04576 [Ceratobasidium sp. AG-Ba]|nr:hypothetical protein RhiJN_04576 [Ceratobasidium sp. AG-Ba]
MFFVGEFTKPVVAKDIVHIRDSVETESLLRGTVFCQVGPCFEWDDDCVKASVLEQQPTRWRQLADPYCDAALVDTFPSATSSTGIDLLESVQHQASKGPGPARDFIEHVNSLPPESIRASHAQILRAKPGGFASARITRVLHSVSYLVPGKSSEDGKYSITQVTNDRTYKRLMETLQMVLDVMGGYAALVERETGKLNPPNAPHALAPERKAGDPQCAFDYFTVSPGAG